MELKKTLRDFQSVMNHYINQTLELKLAREELLDFLKKHWHPSYGKLEDFSRESNKSLSCLMEICKNLDSFLQKEVFPFETSVSDIDNLFHEHNFLRKIRRNNHFLERLTKKKEKLQSLKNDGVEKQLIKELEEEIEDDEEMHKCLENALKEKVKGLSSTANEFLKVFIQNLVTKEKEYYLSNYKISSNLENIMKDVTESSKTVESRELATTNVIARECYSEERDHETPRYSGARRIMRNVISDPDIRENGILVRKIKRLPSTPGGIRLCETVILKDDELFREMPSTSTASLIDDQKSKDGRKENSLNGSDDCNGEIYVYLTVAERDYEAEGEGELSFKEGDVIEVISDKGTEYLTGWIEGSIRGGATGMFCTDYTSELFLP
ncbi:hypothetical protein CDAR_406391 [Caerostris darwini]|uniref:SH3 domain-containing protein n=1 Tax=Caerostris darwini TaxID=1538125 RepID=A0AAV4MNI0_9ARAC|nr:hypothetical protein CDAR_406391 [Caerostris darwini]